MPRKPKVQRTQEEKWQIVLEGIVLEGRGAAVGAGHYSLSQSIFEVPGEAAALGVGEGIAVCVVGEVSRRYQRR